MASRTFVNPSLTEWGLGTAIPSNSDLNDYKTPGVYYVSNSTIAATISNAPYTAGNYKLIVSASGSGATSNYCIQIALSTSSNNNYKLMMRAIQGGAWGEWEYMATRKYVEELIYYAAGDSYDNASPAPTITSIGNITSSSRVIFFTITLPKSLKNITNIVPATLSGSLRGANGYIESASNIDLLSSPYSAAVEKIDDHNVRFRIQKESDFLWSGTSTTVQNNSIVGFYGRIALSLT